MQSEEKYTSTLKAESTTRLMIVFVGNKQQTTLQQIKHLSSTQKIAWYLPNIWINVSSMFIFLFPKYQSMRSHFNLPEILPSKFAIKLMKYVLLFEKSSL